VQQEQQAHQDQTHQNQQQQEQQQEQQQQDQHQQEQQQDQQTAHSEGEQAVLAANEIFIGGLPRNITDTELKEILDTIGTNLQLAGVVSVRMMKDKLSGEPKGFAFAAYPTRKEASKAVDAFNANNNGLDIKGKKVRVTLSENRCRIFIGNIPKDMSREDFLGQLNAQGEGVAHVDFLKDQDNPARNRGFAFVEYRDHMSADRARRNLSRPAFHMGKNTITVNWADPVPEPDEEAMKEVKSLYVRGLPDGANEQSLKEIFEKFGEIEKVVIPPPTGQKRRDFCFIHFVNPESAHNAVLPSSLPHMVQGRELEVSLAKPMDKKIRDDLRAKKLSRQMQRQQPAPAPYPYPVPSARAPYPPPYYQSYPYPYSHNPGYSQPAAQPTAYPPPPSSYGQAPQAPSSAPPPSYPQQPYNPSQPPAYGNYPYYPPQPTAQGKGKYPPQQQNTGGNARYAPY
jgi:heterogeneous nuclear ribonucleoprotein R